MEAASGKENPATSAVNCSESVQKSTLNPNAKEWHPLLDRSHPENRTLFFTFSNGLPISVIEITSFFNQKFRTDVVEKVHVHWPDPRAGPPLSGKVIFNKSLPMEMLLASQKEFKFNVNGKPLWCKRFEPDKNIPPRKRSNVAGGS